jgi:hypothetical protein
MGNLKLETQESQPIRVVFVSLKGNTNTVPWSRYMGKYDVRSSIEKSGNPYKRLYGGFLK